MPNTRMLHAEVLGPTDKKKLKQASAAQQEGNFPLARKIYEDLLRRYPRSTPLLNALGTVLLDQGKPQEASALFQEAAREKPYVPALYNLARLKQLTGHFNEAGRLYETIISIRPDFGPAWNNLALLLRDCGRLSEASRAVEEAVRLMPENPEAFNNLGVILEAMGRLEEAESSFLNAISLQEEYFSAKYNLACLYHRLERFQEAEKELGWILERRPGDPGATYLLQAMGRLPAPERAPAEYVARTFDDCAVVFEERLEALEYRTPGMLFSFIRPRLKKGMKILDLGCGTGLGAEY